MVDRYDIEEMSRNPYQSYRDMRGAEDGDWVRYEDYAELEAQRDRVAGVLREIRLDFHVCDCPAYRGPHDEPCWKCRVTAALADLGKGE